MKMSETQTVLIFCSARKRSVQLNVDLVEDFNTIREMPVETATPHTAAIPSAP